MRPPPTEVPGAVEEEVSMCAYARPRKAEMIAVGSVVNGTIARLLFAGSPASTMGVRPTTVL